MKVELAWDPSVVDSLTLWTVVRPEIGEGAGRERVCFSSSRRIPSIAQRPASGLADSLPVMAVVSTNDLKTGMTLQIEHNLFQVVDFQHVKPGKGPAFVRSTLRNARTGAVIDKTFRAGEKVERAMIDKREMQYLYNDGESYVFMDNETYDQIQVSPESLGDAANYLVETSNATMQMFGSEIVGVDMPASVELNITETEPGVQGDRVSGASKPATLETGLVVQVPLFVEPGTRVKIDTRTGEYTGRV